MIKKILSIFLGLLAVVFLGIGVAYTACPVIPFVKYTFYDEKGRLEYIADSNDLEDLEEPFASQERFSYATFKLNGNLEMFHSYEVFKRILTGTGEYEGKIFYRFKHEDVKQKTTLIKIGFYFATSDVLALAIIPTTQDSYLSITGASLKVSNFKTKLTADDGSYLETKFNPTFIFYLVSAFSLAGVIGINYKWILDKIKKIKTNTAE